MLKMTLIRGLLSSSRVPRLQGDVSGSHCSSSSSASPSSLCWCVGFQGRAAIWAKRKDRPGGEGGVGGKGEFSAELSRGGLWLQDRGHVERPLVSWRRLGNQFSSNCCNAVWGVGNRCNAKRSNSPQRLQEAPSEAPGWIYGLKMKQEVLEKMSLCLGAVVSVDDMCPGTSPVIIISSISQLLSLTCIIQMVHIIPDSNLEYECSVNFLIHLFFLIYFFLFWNMEKQCLLGKP